MVEVVTGSAGKEDEAAAGEEAVDTVTVIAGTAVEAGTAVVGTVR